MIIDTHCHFDLYPNPVKICEESEKLGITTIGMTNLPSHFQMGYNHVKGYKKVRLALGMHPLMVSEHEKEMPLFLKFLDMTSYIGEIGLDFSREGVGSKELQLYSFEQILKAVKGKPKILSIHSRSAEREVLELLRKYDIRNAIFHWYSGGVRLIEEIAHSGYYFSINTAMIKSKKGKEIIKHIPREYLLTESDGPYIESNGKTVKPKNISLIIEYLSKLYSIEQQLVEHLIKINFNRMINNIRIL
ncbi:Qat anti-phage system TatD family nuclease QatD [uncultured Winogradskyella sp.]|uniref:Qat anti-phage system TatD family nuclease QatD n=1 Tax=uncultured Winogradskyella sp. TaxID=395353 RepID=UPI00263764D2|nr:Qat anti-phage system TatD family nuclease QatD [uncultured Winogradskyella sp.]